MPSLLIWTPSASPLGANIPPQLPIPHVRSKDSHFAPPCPVALGLNCLGREEEEPHIIFSLIYIHILLTYSWLNGVSGAQQADSVIQIHICDFWNSFPLPFITRYNCSSLCLWCFLSCEWGCRWVKQFCWKHFKDKRAMSSSCSCGALPVCLLPEAECDASLGA